MSEENKALVKRSFEEATGKNKELMLQLHAEGYVSHRPTGDVTYEEWVKEQDDYSAFSDVRTKVEAQIAEGDIVVTRWTRTATHTGTFRGIPATGKVTTMTGITISRIADGKIAEGWVQADALGLMKQLGAIPS